MANKTETNSKNFKPRINLNHNICVYCIHIYCIHNYVCNFKPAIKFPLVSVLLSVVVCTSVPARVFSETYFAESSERTKLSVSSSLYRGSQKSRTKIGKLLWLPMLSLCSWLLQLSTWSIHAIIEHVESLKEKKKA